MKPPIPLFNMQKISFVLSCHICGVEFLPGSNMWKLVIKKVGELYVQKVPEAVGGISHTVMRL